MRLRASPRDLAALASAPGQALEALRPRIDDFIDGLAAPGANTRLQFARRVVERHGYNPATASGRAAVRAYLEERVRIVGGSIDSARILDDSTPLADRLSLFRERGLATDTSVFADAGVERALESMQAAGVIAPSGIRRVAVIGPGLDFADKLDGYDFYPEQVIQPFAVVDSLRRLGLATQVLEVVAFDLSERVVAHLEAARERARAGRAYTIVLPRNTARPWAAPVVAYWKAFGDRIGKNAPPPQPPPAAGRIDVRAVDVDPAVVRSITAADLNVVTQQVSNGEPFDLVIATNVLLYYSVFEQSLAAANIGRMLRPGGLLVTNNRIFEVPSVPLSGAGDRDVAYMSLPGVGEAGDRMIWYERR